MKSAYKQLIQKPLTKAEVRAAVLITIADGYVDAVTLSHKMRIGFNRADKLAKLMYTAGIIVDSTMRGTVVILKGEPQALNAAYRQLRKVQK